MATVMLKVGSIEIQISEEKFTPEQCMQVAMDALKMLYEREGRSESCFYEGKEYSPGAVIEMPGGPKECKLNGTWMKP